MIFLPLLNNITLLVSLSIVHGLIMRRWKPGSIMYQVLAGLLFGLVTIAGMMNPLRLLPGIIFDGRSIIISIAALFGGPVTAILTGVISAGYRLWLGGAGAIMGVSVITESALLGTAFYYLRRRYPKTVQLSALLAFGVLVHLVMLILTATLPGGASAEVFPKIAFPVITIYPIATVLVCLLFLDQESRLKAEDALRTSEENYRQLVENANSVILRWKPDGVITFMNGYGLRFFGFEEHEIVGHRLTGTIVPAIETSGRDLATMLQDITENPEWFLDNENENVCKDGRLVWVRWRNRPVKNDRGELIEVFSVGIDMTARKRAEIEREQLEEQLRQAQKMEAVGLLAGGVAHDLNNLLTPILGYGEILILDEDLADEHRKEVEEIIQAGGRARDLVRQLMAFGRKQTLSVKSLNLNNIIERFSKLLRRTLREDIRLELVLDPAIQNVTADQGQMEQVIMNLAVNAQDAMPTGGMLIIETAAMFLDNVYAAHHPDIAPGRYVRLTISDTGQGMDKETQERIFEPFFTTKEMGKGAGLGLATVYGIIKQHGGNILVESAPNKGAVFTIYLPVSKTVYVPPKTPNAEIGSVRGEETVLVAEDDPTVRTITCTMLCQLGYKVVDSESASQCLRIAETQGDEIDLLLTDVVMPEMSGRELFERINAIRPSIRAVFMSGYTANVIAERGVLHEDVVFIQKPFTQQELSAKVRQALDTAKA